MYKRISGTKDILPEEVAHWQAMEQICREAFRLYNYQEIRTPIIEEAALFKRSLGEAAEIVQKQMFLLKGDRQTLSLRPEGTAAVARAYLENSLNKLGGLLKVYYLAPMFRAERPQKGRLRQFHHIGCEAIGSGEAYLDAEIISLAKRLLDLLDISGYTIKLNSLGCADDKRRLAGTLRQHLRQNAARLCIDCRHRLKGNALRVLDCKKTSCGQVIQELQIKDSCLCAACKEHFAELRQALDTLRIDYTFSPYLVRGLDYYTRTVFEIVHPQLGAQDALGAGGRYDNLLEELGGAAVPAAGFALGSERLFLIKKPQNHQVPVKELVYIITLGETCKKEGFKIMADLRQAGLAADTDYQNRSLKGAMRRSSDLGARFTLIIGEDELKKGCVALKDMLTGKQEELLQEKIVSCLTQRLNNPAGE